MHGKRRRLLRRTEKEQTFMVVGVDDGEVEVILGVVVVNGKQIIMNI
jgi:hypothetical protein